MAALPVQIGKQDNEAQHEMLHDLRQDLLDWLIIPTAGVAFYTVLFMTRLYRTWAKTHPVPESGPDFTWSSILAAGGIIFACWLAFLLKKRRPRQAAYIYVGGLTGVILILSWVWFNPISMVLLPALIILSITVLNVPATMVIALLASLTIFHSAQYHGQPDGAIFAPLATVWLTTAAAWIANRNLVRATEWALSGYQEANKKTEEARRHRADLMRQHKDLNDAYHQLERFSVQLARAREEADEARRVKQQFVANVSHELRTPLNIIIGFSEAIALSPESYGVKAIPRSLMGDINRIYRSARHLKSLIDDVLDLSQLDTQHMPLLAEQASLSDIIAEAVDMLKSFVTRKGLTLTVDIPQTLPLIFLDRLRIRQVLLNLLSNAARFVESGGIVVSAQVLPEAMQVTVVDTGPGIASEDLERVFEEFQQLDTSLNKRYDGTGLGLALSRRFIELHGGWLWADSELGKGSSFHFTLPLKPKTGQVGRGLRRYLPVASYVETRVGRTILVAAEDPMPGNLLKRHLRDYRVKTVSRRDLPEAIKSYLPHAIITNGSAASPSSNGHIDLDEAPEIAGVPIISCPLPDPSLLSHVLGVDHYLVKPVTRERLLEVLAGYGEAINRILIVDDDLQLVELVARMVRAAPRPYQVDIACGSNEGLTRMQECLPDLVLLDIMMSELDGLTILKFMRADERLHQVPVIMITARDLPQTDIRLPGQNCILIEGATDFSASEVLTCIQAILDTLPQSKPVVLPEPGPEERPPALRAF